MHMHGTCMVQVTCTTARARTIGLGIDLKNLHTHFDVRPIITLRRLRTGSCVLNDS